MLPEGGGRGWSGQAAKSREREGEALKRIAGAPRPCPSPRAARCCPGAAPALLLSVRPLVVDDGVGVLTPSRAQGASGPLPARSPPAPRPRLLPAPACLPRSLLLRARPPGAAGRPF